MEAVGFYSIQLESWALVQLHWTQSAWLRPRINAEGFKGDQLSLLCICDEGSTEHLIFSFLEELMGLLCCYRFKLSGNKETTENSLAVVLDHDPIALDETSSLGISSHSNSTRNKLR